MKEVCLQNGKLLLIIKAIPEDGEKLMHYKNMISMESIQFFNLWKQWTRNKSRKEQRNISGINSKPNSLLTLAFIDDEIVGAIVFRRREKIRTQHVGEMGVTVGKGFWEKWPRKLITNHVLKAYLNTIFLMVSIERQYSSARSSILFLWKCFWRISSFFVI